MTLEQQLDILENSDMLRIIKDDTEVFVGYLASFALKVGNNRNEIYERYKDDEVNRFRAVPEIRHKRWRELNLMSPLKPEETPDFRFSDLQMKLYYTIYV